MKKNLKGKTREFAESAEAPEVLSDYMICMYAEDVSGSAEKI